MQNTHPATTPQPMPIILSVHLVKSTDSREINGQLHASAVLEQDYSHELFLTIMASPFISTFAQSHNLSKLGLFTLS
jgi:hypothetical protein